MVFWYLAFRPQDFKNGPKCSPKWCQVGQTSPILGHLGVILAPSWRQVRPSCRHFGHPAPVQNRPKSAKTASWPFFFPRSPPRAPRPPPGIDFLAFRIDFSSFLSRFSLDFRFQIRPFSMDFQRKGPAVLAAGVFDNRQPLATGVTEPSGPILQIL